MAPIHQAARKNDVVALQRELDAGVSPDLRENDFSGTYRPLADVIVFGSAVRPPETIHRRLACIEALLEAGASLGVVAYSGLTALHLAVARTDRSSYPANFELIVDRLMRAGADVNATNEDGISVLAMAASNGCSTVIAKLLSAGAVDPEGFDEPLRCALFRPEPRICALLMRAGAKLPIPGPGSHQWLERSPYLLKIHRTPGGFLCRNQKRHRRLDDSTHRWLQGLREGTSAAHYGDLPLEVEVPVPPGGNGLAHRLVWFQFWVLLRVTGLLTQGDRGSTTIC